MRSCAFRITYQIPEMCIPLRYQMPLRFKLNSEILIVYLALHFKYKLKETSNRQGNPSSTATTGSANGKCLF